MHTRDKRLRTLLPIINMQSAEETCFLYFQDLQLRHIPEATFPAGYTVHTWQEGAEDIWINIVTKAFGKSFLAVKAVWTSEFFIKRYFSKPQFRKDGFFLVKHNEDFVATVFAWQEEEVSNQGMLHWLAVVPEHRRKGIAQSLCNLVLQYHKDHGKTMVWLKTEIYREHAVELYKRVGFTNSLVQNDKDFVYYYFKELQSREIPEPEFPQGYSVHKWHDGAEDSWLKIVQGAFGYEYVSKKLGSEGFMEKYFKKAQFKKDCFFFVKDANEYVATVFAWQDEVFSSCGRILWLAVLPNHRGKGIAQSLCYCVLKYHKNHGKAYVWLRIGPFKTREIAKTLYEKVGFKKEDF